MGEFRKSSPSVAVMVYMLVYTSGASGSLCSCTWGEHWCVHAQSQDAS